MILRAQFQTLLEALQRHHEKQINDTCRQRSKVVRTAMAVNGKSSLSFFNSPIGYKVNYNKLVTLYLYVLALKPELLILSPMG